MPQLLRHRLVYIFEAWYEGQRATAQTLTDPPDPRLWSWISPGKAMSINARSTSTGRWCKFGGGDTSVRTHLIQRSLTNPSYSVCERPGAVHLSTQPCSCIQTDYRADRHEEKGLLHSKTFFFVSRVELGGGGPSLIVVFMVLRHTAE